VPKPEPGPKPVHADSVGSDDTHVGDDVNDEAKIYEQLQIYERLCAQILSARKKVLRAMPRLHMKPTSTRKPHG
jgi:hypothetical protein